MIARFKKYYFLFEELVARDFKQKYKRSMLGMGWSILSPLLQLLVMRLVFTQFFGRNTPHYTTYLFAGNIVMSYYKEATKGGMKSLYSNRTVFTKINVPKYLFVLSKNVSALINFLLTVIVFFLFCAIDHIHFGIHMVALIFPIVCEAIFCVGVGMILSAMLIFFRDTEYLYDIFLTLLTYFSAIFYTVDRYSPQVQRMFLLNPVYVYIKYFRLVVIEATIPSVQYHRLCLFYALISLAIGGLIYKKFNHKFLYYI